MLAVVGTVSAATASDRHTVVARAVPLSNYVPPAKHVFVINIENKGYAETWGRLSKAPYLAHTLRNKGVLLYNYYGTAHNSQPNYIAQISGQAPNPQMQGDCQIYSSFTGIRHAGTAAGRRHGLCVPHVGEQLADRSSTAAATRGAATCRT